jgi:hypothetical protein
MQTSADIPAISAAFGRAFIHEKEGFDWWMVEDEYGRDPALRYRHSSLLAFARTLLSKRIEDGEHPNVIELFDQLAERMTQLIADGYAER